jgi:NitT/TauT family transport system ATP-binding protein
VICDFTLTIDAGEFFCLVGPSGCGKSTVLKMIAGIEAPTSGSLVRPSRVGMVFQSYALLPWLNAEENVAFAARMQGHPEKRALTMAKRYLRMVHLETFAKKYPRELSGGQRQRVGIARALITESEVLLLDEPFSALDPIITDELHEDLLRIWAATRKTIVMVSHHFEEAAVLADRVGVMKNGCLEYLIDVALPRPRCAEGGDFTNQVKLIRACLVTDPSSLSQNAKDGENRIPAAGGDPRS